MGTLPIAALCLSLFGPPEVDPGETTNDPDAVGRGEAEPAPPGYESPQAEPEARSAAKSRRASRRRRGESPTTRRFSVGLGAVGFQVPTLRNPGTPIDRRFTGPSMSMVGLALFGRYAPVDAIALDLSIRSGGVRFRTEDEVPNVTAYDMIVGDVGVILFFLRGPIGRLGVDAGVGGIAHLARYDINERDSSQLWGSFAIRAGVDVELTARRVAFVVNVRGYGIVSTPDVVRSRGPLFETKAQPALAPSPRLQTAISGSLGLAYRF